jgi:hypothetical protein
MLFKRTNQNQRSAGRGPQGDSLRVCRWWIVVGLLLCLACVSGVSAYNSKAHYDLAIDALRDEGVGIDQPQIWYVAEMDNMADMIGKAKETDYAVLIDWAIVPELDEGGYDNEEIEQRMSSTAHFQGFDNYTEMNTEWIRLQEQTYLAVQDAEKRQDTGRFLAILGMSMHTVQDFYAHSTWPEETEAKGLGDVTWFQVKEEDKNDAAMPGLHSNNHSDSPDHVGINKDGPARPYYGRSYRQAYYASREWTKLVRTWVSPEFWDQAMAPDIDTSNWGYNLNMFFYGLAAKVGAWSDPYSKYYPDLVTLIADNFQQIMLSSDYSAPWLLGKVIGSDYLYNQTTPTFDPENHHHPALLPELKVDEIRWLNIDTGAVQQTDCDHIWNIDVDPIFYTDEAEFYYKITVNGHSYLEAPFQGDDYLDYYYDLWKSWDEWIPLSMDAESVVVQYQLYDEDGGWYGGPDHCDINPQKGQKDWIQELSTGESKTQIITNGRYGCSFWTGTKGDGDEAEVGFTYQFIPQGEGGSARLGLRVDAVPDIIHSGDSVTYTFTVSNGGTRPLSDVAITDDIGLIPALVGGDDGNGQLDAGETWTYTATKTLATETGNVMNTATVSATDATGSSERITVYISELVEILHPAIQVEKTVSSSSINRGESVTYTYSVTNTGDVNLSDIRVIDDKVTPVPVLNAEGTANIGDTNGNGWLNIEEMVDLASICDESGNNCQIGDTDGDGKLSPEELEALEGALPTTPAEVWMYTASSSPTHTVTNTATAFGTDPLDLTVSSTDTTTVVVTVIVKVDIKPGSCPNGFGLKDKGVVPVAILGGLSDYTIDEIKTSSIKLNGVPTSKIQSQDVATPYMGTGTCGCHILTQDSIQDVLFQFDAPKVAGTLSNSQKKTNVPITLTGTLKDGITLVKGSDCLKIS